jgi:hypothetical protein
MLLDGFHQHFFYYLVPNQLLLQKWFFQYLLSIQDHTNFMIVENVELPIIWCEKGLLKLALYKMELNQCMQADSSHYY